MAVVNVAVLAKATQTQISRMVYGSLRRKLVKQGFSEIALYQSVNNHCIENDIAPAKMAKDMLELIEGCGSDVFFPKTSDNFHFLRGCYHDLRLGDLERSEAKAPEQRGLFLCNRCYLVLDDKKRSPRKTEKNTCDCCAKENSRRAAARNNKATKERTKQNTEAQEAQPTISENTVEELSVNESTPKREQALTLVEREHESSIKITEVMADENEASVSIKCPTPQLAAVLAMISTAI